MIPYTHKQDHGISFGGYIDIGRVAVRVFRERRHSLSHLTQSVLGIHLVKSKSIQLSNWSAWRCSFFLPQVASFFF